MCASSLIGARYSPDSMRERAILVTGFEPFGGETVNASWEAARRLDGWRFGDAVAVARQLPCAYDGCVAEFVQAFERSRPEIVLMTGQAARRAVISVERLARLAEGSVPDNHGAVRSAVAADGPPFFEAAAAANVARAIRAAGLAARVSTNAGDYVCNHLFYGALRHLAESAPATPAVFVHLPAAPGQTPHLANARRLATPDAARALKAAIAAMCDERNEAARA